MRSASAGVSTVILERNPWGCSPGVGSCRSGGLVGTHQDPITDLQIDMNDAAIALERCRARGHVTIAISAVILPPSTFS